MEKVKINKNMDIYKSKSKSESIVSCRLPRKYKESIKENRINVAKLIMRGMEQIDKSLVDYENTDETDEIKKEMRK